MGSNHSDDREGLDKVVMVDRVPEEKMLDAFAKRGEEVEDELKAEQPSKAEMEAKLRKALKGTTGAAIGAAIGAEVGKPLFTGPKLTPSDQGPTQFQVGHTNDKKKVILDFGKPVAWIGFTPNEAFSVSKALRKHAKKCRG